MSLSMAYSILFFAAFLLYFFFALYVLHLNRKAATNKAFFIVCLCLCIWSFSFAMANDALTGEICLIWRRISAVGWVSLYSVLLHFLLILTGRAQLFRHRLFSALFYLPAAFNLFVFSLSDQMTRRQYNLEQAQCGWVNIAVNNIWDYLFYLYYIGYVAVSIVIVWRWRRKTKRETIKKQANLIMASLGAALLLGSLTDIVLAPALKNALPQMAPIFIFIPILAFYYLIRRSGLMNRDSEELMATDETRNKLFFYFSVIICFIGLQSFAVKYIQYQTDGIGDLYYTLTADGLVVALGIVIGHLSLVKEGLMKYTLRMALTLLSIPLVALRYPESAGITAWAFPVILMIISLVFSKKTFLTLTAASAILTQFVLLINMGTTGLELHIADYAQRIGLFIIVYLLGSFINDTYRSKLKENAHQIDFQKIISDSSFDFIQVNQTNIHDKINHLLTKLGAFFQVDRTYLFLLNHDRETMTCSYEWCDDTISSEMDSMVDVPFHIFPWWMNQLEENHLVRIEDVSGMPDQAQAEREALSRQNIQSLIAVPVEANGTILGFVGFDSVRIPRAWSEEHVKMLRIFTNLLADAFMKIQTEIEIEFLAYFDHLTGLPNRTLFSDRVTQAIHLAGRTEKFIGIVYIDIDGFKTITDTIGQNGGDTLISSVAASLSGNLRKSDTVAHIESDKFLVLLNNVPEETHFKTITENLMRLFTKPFRIEDQEYYMTASAGVAVFPVDGSDTDTLITNADIAMSKAKARGKNKIVFCTSEMKEEVHKNMVLSNSLYRSLANGEMSVYYQPQILLSSGRVIGLEALLRWSHPLYGMVPPGVFIPLAEISGLINSLGEWVLNDACRTMKSWHDAGLKDLRIAVNLSVVQFKNPNLVDIVQDAISESGINPGLLELEITESVAINETDLIITQLERLKTLGVTISIDDFGTQYSSLSRLKTLPIDRIKIDMQFIKGLEYDDKDQAITEVIINLAKSLKLQVLAEGVETRTQLEFLSRYHCDEVQGYFYARPAPAKEIEKLLFQSFSGF